MPPAGEFPNGQSTPVAGEKFLTCDFQNEAGRRGLSPSACRTTVGLHPIAITESCGVRSSRKRRQPNCHQRKQKLCISYSRRYSPAPSGLAAAQSVYCSSSLWWFCCCAADRRFATTIELLAAQHNRTMPLLFSPIRAGGIGFEGAGFGLLLLVAVGLVLIRR